MFYGLVKKLVCLSVNVLNFMLAGNLPPFVCVGVIIEEQGRYLVIESTDGDLAFPRGFMRWREYPAQAAQREGKEETGLLLHIGDVVGHYSRVSSRYASISACVIIYHAVVVGGELRSSIEGQPRWLDELEVRSKMDSFSHTVLDDYLRYRSEHAKLTVSDKARSNNLEILR